MTADEKRRKELKTLGDEIVKSVDRLIASHFKNVLGVDVNDQHCVNKFNSLIKDLFRDRSRRGKDMDTFRGAIVRRLGDVFMIITSLGGYHFFFGG